MKLCWIPLLLAGAMAAQVAQQANQRYQTKDGRAQIAANLGAADRNARQRPKELIAALGIRKGTTVCDLGTGVGFMLPYLAEAVGGNGKVIAQDIFPDFLDKARATAAYERLEHVRFVLGTDRDPKLPTGACDLVLVLDAYHHFDFPSDMTRGIREALTPKGRFALVDFYKRPGAMGTNTDAVAHIRLDIDDAVKEVEQNGFKAVKRGEHIPNSQYFVLFERK